MNEGNATNASCGVGYHSCRKGALVTPASGASGNEVDEHPTTSPTRTEPNLRNTFNPPQRTTAPSKSPTTTAQEAGENAPTRSLGVRRRGLDDGGRHALRAVADEAGRALIRYLTTLEARAILAAVDAARPRLRVWTHHGGPVFGATGGLRGLALACVADELRGALRRGRTRGATALGAVAGKPVAALGCGGGARTARVTATERLCGVLARRPGTRSRSDGCS